MGKKKRKKGIIALDIDGTITATKHQLSEKVSDFLNELGLEWHLLFLTGRSLSFTRPILSTITSSYFLAVQNGAALYRQSGEELISQKYIALTLLPKIEAIVHEAKCGILLESGEQEKDRVFYKPKEFTPIELSYIDYRKSFSPEDWIACEGFDSLPIKKFALGKVLTTKEQAMLIHQRVEEKMGNRIRSIVLHDPFRAQGYLVHLNAREASKREALCDIKEELNCKGPLIGAGDDLNDYEMLMMSDVKIVMETAPEPLCYIADILAPSAKSDGIIEGITKAIKSL